MSAVPAEAAPFADAACAATLFAVDPVGLGGIALRAPPGPVRESWLALLCGALPPESPLRRLPPHAADDRVLGGLDLAATLHAGRPVAERGVLAEADGGVLIVPMAERLAPMRAAQIVSAMDKGAVAVERDGLSVQYPTRFGVVALDEGADDDEAAPSTLTDRLAFHIDLSAVSTRDASAAPPSPEAIAAARGRLGDVAAGEEVLAVLCATAAALGIASIRAVILGLNAARAAAALGGRSAVTDADAVLAARLVLAPRATTIPAAEQQREAQSDGEDAATEMPADSNTDPDAADAGERSLEDVVRAAAVAALPPGLLAKLAIAAARGRVAAAGGRAGAVRASPTHGRPAGTRRGLPRGGARLHVVETLRAAAPWQRLRRQAVTLDTDDAPRGRIEIRPDDFRVRRFVRRAETLTIFVVDASGSAAFQRLAEAKGAVQLLLADCYVRRDSVALIAFRGGGAELLLPPTRSLVRAKRATEALPGGGGTPLAAGIDAALAVADAARRKGRTPFIVFLTDGRANIARDGSASRPVAEGEAAAAARALRTAGFPALLVDTSPQPREPARRLAAEMNALYVPPPYADAASLSTAVAGSARRSGRIDNGSGVGQRDVSI